MDQSRNDADVAFIKALAELLNEHDLTELRVKREYDDHDSLNVHVSRVTGQTIYQMGNSAGPQRYADDGYRPEPALTPSGRPAADTAQNTDPAQHPGAVTSPMVGTAYLAAEPGSANFVAVGDTVSEGDTLMIIEAMKTMNHIPAPRAGVVRRILVTDATPVEYGAPLMIIE